MIIGMIKGAFDSGSNGRSNCLGCRATTHGCSPIPPPGGGALADGLGFARALVRTGELVGEARVKRLMAEAHLATDRRRPATRNPTDRPPPKRERWRRAARRVVVGMVLAEAPRYRPTPARTPSLFRAARVMADPQRPGRLPRRATQTVKVHLPPEVALVQRVPRWRRRVRWGGDEVRPTALSQ
jgi:hypothetical protein